MPRAFDRQPPNRNDKDPTRVLDFNDLDSAIAESGERIRTGLPAIIYQLTGLDISSWEAFIESMADGVGIDLPFIKDIVEFFQSLFGGGFNPGALPTPEQAVTAFVNEAVKPLHFFAELVEGVVINPVLQVAELAAAMFAGFFPGDPGGGPTDPVAKAQYTIEAIKDAVINGYTVETITTSESWAGPAGSMTELIVILVASGEDGANGGATFSNSGGANGGAAGRGGGYLVQTLSPGDITFPVDITIGVNGGATSFGSYASVGAGAAGGMATQFGYSDTISTPGAGGKGGNVTSGSSSQAGVNGVSSAAAAGGSGGAGVSGGNGAGGAGAAGGNADPAATTKCGGGGGGGGGSRWSFDFPLASAWGGDGGDGGYPGGGGGGGGAAAVPITPQGYQCAGGLGGLGAPGIVWIFYRGGS